jgi:hypothetical protein
VALAVALTAASSATGCAGARSTLNTTASACFKALPAADAAVHGKGRLVGVRQLDTTELARRLPEAAALGHRQLCGVAYEANYGSGDVAGTDTSRAGRFALVLVDHQGHQVVAAYVVDQLPMRFSHRV